MVVAPIWRLSGSAGLEQRGKFRPFVCVEVRRYGREMPGYRSVAIPDHFVARRHVGMVAIRQAATAWLFATIILSEAVRKRSRFAGLRQRGILRPNVWYERIGNGRKLPGCNGGAFLDRFLVGWCIKMVVICLAVARRQITTASGWDDIGSAVCGAPDRAF